MLLFYCKHIYLYYFCRQLKDEQIVLCDFEEKTEQERVEQEEKQLVMKEKIKSLENSIADYDVELNEHNRLLQMMTKEHSLQVVILEAFLLKSF